MISMKAEDLFALPENFPFRSYFNGGDALGRGSHKLERRFKVPNSSLASPLR